MTRRIMDRLRNHPTIKVSLVVGLILMVPAWTEAAKISSSATTDALRDEARALPFFGASIPGFVGLLTWRGPFSPAFALIPGRSEARASSSPLSISAMIDILHTGTPVYATSTTTYSDGTSQIADLRIVPNTSTGTVTTTKDIKLADGKLEKVVDVATISGSTTTQTVTTTLPGGSIQTKKETEVTKGDKTIIKGTVSMPGGGTQTIAGQTIQSGSRSVTSLTITNPAGHVYHDRITITHNGQLSQTETNTTQGPGGSITTVKSTTNTVLNPSGAGQNDAAPLTIPPPKAAAQVLNLKAQVLGSQAGTSDAGTTPLPSPIPEPSALIVFGVLLVAAGATQRGRWATQRGRC